MLTVYFNLFSKRVFCRVPYLNEAHKRKCLNLVRRAGLSDFVSLWFDCGKPLRRIFQPPKETLTCNTNCNTCICNTSTFNQCLLKNVIYEITCGLCPKIYIGESSRQVKYRILEHSNTNNKSSAVVQHFASDHQSSDVSIKWRLLHSGLHSFEKRLILEAHYIGKVPANILMNGCNGRNNFLSF